jgi:hypothetical protein
MFQGMINFSNVDPKGTWTSRGRLKYSKIKEKYSYIRHRSNNSNVTKPGG